MTQRGLRGALSRPTPTRGAIETSDYERRKYDATLEACGDGPYHRALELGSSIGVFSARLAPRCHSLVTVDAAPSAVADARRRLAGMPSVQVLLGGIPDAIPEGSFDLVVASEILYYLEPDALAATFARLRDVAGDARPAGRRPLAPARRGASVHRGRGARAGAPSGLAVAGAVGAH